MRYRLKLARWTVVREGNHPSPRELSSPEGAARLAMDVMGAADDDKEHFWVLLLNAQNHYLMHTEVSVGTQSATLVHPREVLGPAVREGASSIVLVPNHPSPRVFFSAARRSLRAAKCPSCTCPSSWANPARSSSEGKTLRASSVMPSKNLHWAFGPTARLIALLVRVPSAAAQPSAGPDHLPEVIESGTSRRPIVTRSSGVASRTVGRGGRG